ncbi:hypothetical protein ABZW03_41030, partial [Kitasatospora sp. NPDC004799]|uniref:hypothetical protein n=1 Tax=Kitasatospora sp. NPDC004799 TaxID=3154460 RepID=UPI00339F4DF9
AIALYGWRRRSGLRAAAGRTGADRTTRRRVLLALALCAVAGAVAHAWWWLAGPDAVTTGLPLDAVVEGVLSDAAKGGGAGLIGALAVYVLGWWTWRTWRTVTATRPRGSGAASGRDGAPGADTTG